MGRNENLIIVSMTSWKKRIDNVATVLESLIDQEVKPDFIELNLSDEEFPDGCADLPEDLNRLLYQCPFVEINWVKGNDGVFKKIIPTLKKFYGKDYYLLSVDDDWLYRYDYIRLMVEYIESYKCDSFCLANANIIGNRMIYKSNCFEEDFWKKLTKEVIETRIDDYYIEYYFRSKGKKMCHFRPTDTPDITKRFNPICPNSGNASTGQYSITDIRNSQNIVNKIRFN